MEGAGSNPERKDRTISPEVVKDIVDQTIASTEAAILDRIVRDATTRPHTGAHSAPYEPRQKPQD